MELKKPAPNNAYETEKKSRWGFRGMTVRDWLPIVGALLIPVVVAAGTWWITWQQGKIADQRAAVERELADQRAQDEALQAYLDQMGGFLLERNLGSTDSSRQVYTLARARTLTILRRLDPNRKEIVLQFLYEAGLLTEDQDLQDGPNLDMSSADLSGIDLSSQPYPSIDLGAANLSNANLQGAYIAGADLHRADLSEADLSGAVLSNLVDNYWFGGYPWTNEVDLSEANLNGADLNNTCGITKAGLERQTSFLHGTKFGKAPSLSYCSKKEHDWRTRLIEEIEA